MSEKAFVVLHVQVSYLHLLPSSIILLCIHSLLFQISIYIFSSNQELNLSSNEIFC